MGTDATKGTIVLIHGFWVTPRSWEHWIAHYERRGYRVLAPAYPGLRGRGRGAQRRPVADRGADGARDHRAPRGGRRRARRAADPDRATRPAACSRRSCSTTASARPAWRSTRRRPRASRSCRCRRSGRRSRCSRTRPTATGPSASRSSSGTTRSRTPSARRSRGALYERYHIPASGAIFWEQRAAPTSSPATRRHLGRLRERRPARRCCSSRAARTTSCRRRSSGRTRSTTSRTTVTEVKEFEGPHLLPAQDGLGGGRRLRARLGGEHAIARRPRVTDVRITHIGGPTVADRGRRLAAADRPDVRPARRHATASAGARGRASWPGPAIAAADLAADRRGPAHPRPPRRQPRRRRSRAAARRPAPWSRPTSGARRLGGGARGLAPWADDAARGARAGRRSRSRPRPAATVRR